MGYKTNNPHKTNDRYTLLSLKLGKSIVKSNETLMCDLSEGKNQTAF